MNRTMKVITYTLSALLLSGVACLQAETDVPRITKEELKAMLGNEDLVVLDVRRGKDWRSSEFKITGAVQAAPGDYRTWSGRYNKDATVVLYCA